MSRFNVHKPLEIYNISQRRILASIVLGLICSILLYLWQQYLFTLLRFSNIGFRYNVDYILSDSNLSKLSIYFAGNAILIGNAIAIAFLCHKWKRNRKLNQHLSRIRNNQSFLIGSYYFWSFKITFLILVINLFENVDFGLIHAFFFLVPFLFIALFLESVKDLRRYLKSYDLKVLCVHGLIICSLILVFSFFNKSVYNRLSNLQEKENPFVHLPVVNNEDGSLFDKSYYSYPNISNVKVLQNGNSLEYRFYRMKYSIDDLINNIIQSGYNNEPNRQRVSLYVERDIPYYKLRELEMRLAYHNIQRVFYLTQDTIMGRQIGFRKNLYLKKEMFDARIDGFPPPPYFYEDKFKDDEKTHVSLDQFLLNEKIDKNRVEEYFYTTVNKEIVFQFHIDKTITLQHYIDFMNSYRASVRLLRKEYKERNANNLIKPAIMYPFHYVEKF